MLLDKASLLRYNRQFLLPEINVIGQKKIQEAKVLIIGAGGLGCPALLYLASSGIGNLGIVDFDTVAIHNLPRQILYNDSHIGLSKAKEAARLLSVHNPLIKICPYHCPLNIENAERMIASYDIIIDCTDNFETRYLCNDTCVKLGKTLVYGSILNFQGQMALFNHNGSKNLRDLFPEAPKNVPSCSENGVMSTLPGVIGLMMAQETLKIILDLPTLKNELLVFETIHWSLQKYTF